MGDMCEIEMSFDEVSLLRNLLKVETVYQVRVQITKEQSNDSKVVKIIGTFDTHNWLDQHLLTILNEIKKNEASLEGPLVNLVMMDKKVVKLYHMLITETPKILNIPAVKEVFEKLGPGLKDKITAALEKAEQKESNVNVSINMGGVGIA